MQQDLPETFLNGGRSRTVRTLANVAVIIAAVERQWCRSWHNIVWELRLLL